jgi:hypothetical protein
MPLPVTATSRRGPDEYRITFSAVAASTIWLSSSPVKKRWTSSAYMYQQSGKGQHRVMQVMVTAGFTCREIGVRRIIWIGDGGLTGHRRETHAAAVARHLPRRRMAGTPRPLRSPLMPIAVAGAVAAPTSGATNPARCAAPFSANRKVSRRI